MYDDTRQKIIDFSADTRLMAYWILPVYAAGCIITRDFLGPSQLQDSHDFIKLCFDVAKVYPLARVAVQGTRALGQRYKGTLEDRFGLTGPRPRP